LYSSPGIIRIIKSRRLLGRPKLEWDKWIELVSISGVGFYLKTETESRVRNIVLNKKQDDG
jgi:hypothetical protein